MQESYADRIVRENLEKDAQLRRREEWLRQCLEQEEASSRRERIQARMSRSNAAPPSTADGSSAFLSFIVVALAGFMIFTCAHRGPDPDTKKKSPAPRVEPHRPRHRKPHARPSKGIPSPHTEVEASH